MKQSNWWKNAVVYQIYPRSFQDSNNDGIGDLQGIKDRIPYLKKLGVDVIWLNPIYDSPDQDNGYDISDYRNIASKYGSLKDFKQLLNTLHEQNMKLVMDLVVNHTSDQHDWFKASRKSRSNKYSDYYIWRDPVNGHEPNNWGSSFGGSAWTYVPERKQYYLHLFAEGQPDLNWENPQVRQSVYEIMRYWLDMGIDGYRMDVINFISKPEGLPDYPCVPGAKYSNSQAAVADGPRLNEFLQEMNREVLSKYDIMTVGEMPNVTPEDAINYTGLDRKELNMVFQFEHVSLGANPDPRFGQWNDEPINLVELKQVLSKWQNKLNGKAWNSLYWNNHDRPRAVSHFANDDPKYRINAAKMLGTTLHMMQGTPYIYEGEEIGMTNAHLTSIDQYEDIESLNIYHDLVEKEAITDSQTMLKYLASISRDNARTPMQWDDSNNAGFTEGTPWYRLNDNYPTINVKQALSDKESVFYHYQKLVELRHQYEIIRLGSYNLLDPQDEEVFAYERIYNNQKLLVISNFTDSKLQREYNEELKGHLLISNYKDDLGMTLRPYESKVYLLD
ncbi:glycoside hydrolase family 13 protein [Bombilactobacillus bombi]|uniref:glycoside hydrolase family 13 protein n=1 Tax=Bombilactobacillus bombi TaxID=1303590 RepID=UPI0015E606FB|nr:alpha-glucosidase [Bombilactobacillus bombi]MBA1433678.1 alpha-glucosidase [Bombilactobacillus bombi]